MLTAAAHKDDVDLLLLHRVPDELVLHIDVLGSLAADGVVCKCDGAFAVHADSERRVAPTARN